MKETQNIEFKRQWRDDFLAELCGFANAQGGTLYIGVDDKGSVVGIENAKQHAYCQGVLFGWFY